MSPIWDYLELNDVHSDEAAAAFDLEQGFEKEKSSEFRWNNTPSLCVYFLHKHLMLINSFMRKEC